MGKKKIPSPLKEYLERQIVRGSAGYEPIIAVLKSSKESDLYGFLEFYEDNIRDGLIDVNDTEQDEIDILAHHGKLLQDEESQDREQEDKLASLFQKLAVDEDE